MLNGENAVAMELVHYVGDRLHDLLGISDRYVVEYLIGLAGKSVSAASFIQQLRDTDTVTVDDSMVAFAQELWNKVSQWHIMFIIAVYCIQLFSI